jgi:hypothetical protein
MALTGGCACGAVRYETDAEPFHRTLCHCVDCRRAAAAPQDHTWASQRVGWMRVDDMRVPAGLPVYPRSRKP